MGKRNQQLSSSKKQSSHSLSSKDDSFNRISSSISLLRKEIFAMKLSVENRLSRQK